MFMRPWLPWNIIVTNCAKSFNYCHHCCISFYFCYVICLAKQQKKICIRPTSVNMLLTKNVCFNRTHLTWIFQPPMSMPHPTALTSVHAASLPHFLPSPALASPVGSSSSQPGMGVSNPPCSTLFVANLGQFVSEHELKEIFARFVSSHSVIFTHIYSHILSRVCNNRISFEFNTSRKVYG